MTISAICRESTGLMIRVGGGCIILLMTINALDTKRTEKQEIGRGIRMAGIAIGGYMCPDQRETTPLMDLCNIIHDPRNRGMASGTLWPHGLIMDVGMTGITLFACF